VTNTVDGDKVQSLVLSYVTSNKFFSCSGQPWLPSFSNWPVEFLNPLSTSSKTDSTISISRIEHHSNSSSFHNWIDPEGCFWLNVISPWLSVGSGVIDNALMPWSSEVLKMESFLYLLVVEISR